MVSVSSAAAVSDRPGMEEDRPVIERVLAGRPNGDGR